MSLVNKGWVRLVLVVVVILVPRVAVMFIGFKVFVVGYVNPL